MGVRHAADTALTSGNGWENRSAQLNKSAPEQLRQQLFIPGASPAIEELTDAY